MGIKDIRFGIIGAGSIAHTFSKALKGLGGNLYAISSRNIKKASAFKETYGFKNAYGSYEDMVKDPHVDIVYVATPHALHKTHMMLALSHGKHVICEKPFTLNAVQAQHVFSYAKSKNLFVMEAMWTKFLPVIKEVQDIVSNGDIGTIEKVTSAFCFKIDQDHKKDRLFNMDMGAGALLDIGIYNVTFSYLFLGMPKKISSKVLMHQNGMDLEDDVFFEYENQSASFFISLKDSKPADAMIYGTKGMIKVFDFFRTEKAEVYDLNGHLVKQIEHPHKFNGFEYQIEDVVSCLMNQKIESDVMSYHETLNILKIMDHLRKNWNLVYPTER